ncbi:MAG: flagellar motor protein MotB [Rickettsiales bacterium]
MEPEELPLSTEALSRMPELPEDEGWLITFADMSALLMCFFVLLFSLSKPDEGQFKKVAESLRKQGYAVGDNPIADPYDQTKRELTMALGQSGYDKFTAVSTSKQGVDVELSSTSFFQAGQAKFTAEAIPVLMLISKQIAPLAKQDVLVVVEGHTDDTPVSSAQFPSNWELSTARAANVVRYLIAQGFPANKLRVTGFGDTQPKAVNRDSAGNPIPANQELNRRVVIRMVKGDDNL